MHPAVAVLVLSWLGLTFALRQDPFNFTFPVDDLSDVPKSPPNLTLSQSSPNSTFVLDEAEKHTYWTSPQCHQKAIRSAQSSNQGNFDDIMKLMFEMACNTRDSLSSNPVDRDFARVFKMLFNHDPDSNSDDTVFEMDDIFKMRFRNSRQSSYPNAKGPILAVVKDICENWVEVPSADPDGKTKATTYIECDNVKGAENERFSFKNGKDGATWDKKYQLLGPDGVDCDTMNQGDGVSSSSIRTGFTSIHMLKAGEGEDVWLPEDRSVITICDYSFQFNFNLARRVGIDWQQFFPTSLLSTREPVAINKWGIVAVHGHATF